MSQCWTCLDYPNRTAGIRAAILRLSEAIALMKFSLKQLTQQGSSEGLCVVAVMAATFTRRPFSGGERPTRHSRTSSTLILRMVLPQHRRLSQMEHDRD
jgi:hypothetical protein